MEQKNKGRNRVKIAVFFVLAIHGIGLMALLMQGCGQSKEPVPPPEATETNELPPFVEPTPPPPPTNEPPVVEAAPVVPETPPPPPVVPVEVTEYTIVKGDYLERVARNHHISLKALLEANPGIEPTRLKIGQKIRLPAATAPAATVAPQTAPTEAAVGSGEKIYTVKSGDTLTRIARHFGTTPKAISAANNLKTTSIKVGQKLKIPTKAAALPATAPSAPITPVETVPMAPAAPPPPTPPET